MPKRSHYTVLAPLDGGGVLYHTSSQAMVTLDAKEVELLRELDLKNGITSSFDEEARMLFSQLRDLGLLVDDPEAEADLMLYRHNRHRNNKKVLELTISPTRMCNFDCDYCYIKKRDGLMSEEVQNALLAFVKRHYSETPYQTLKVNWYGGEPLLALDIMEALSARFMAFCAKHSVRYTAHVLSNGSLATKDVCRRLAKNCRVATVMPSISGNGVMHDWQRTAKDGKQHFDDLMTNIDNMIEAGITVHANFVVNHNNFEECKKLAVKLNKKPGIVIRLTRTFAYGRESFKLHDGKDTPLVFFERAEFAPYYLDFHRALNLDAAGYRDVMKPICMYCAACMSRELMLPSVIAFIATRKFMNRFDCNAFSIPCPDMCSTRRINQEKFTMCLTHALNMESGIPSACEYDLPAALSQQALIAVSGHSPYMGNTCPIPLIDGEFKQVFGATKEQLTELAKDPANAEHLWMTQHSVAHRHLPDPNENAPYGIAPFAYDQKFGATMRYDFSRDAGKTITLCKFSPDVGKMFISKGEIVESSGQDRENCTQLVFYRLNDSLKAHRAQCQVGIHVALVYGDYTQELVALANAIGVEPLVVD